jgi:hypothetical protein
MRNPVRLPKCTKVFLMDKFLVDRTKLKPLSKCSRTKTYEGKRISKNNPYSEWVWTDALSNFSHGQEVSVADVEEALEKSDLEFRLFKMVDKGLLKFSFDPAGNDFTFWSVDSNV